MSQATSVRQGLRRRFGFLFCRALTALEMKAVAMLCCLPMQMPMTARQRRHDAADLVAMLNRLQMTTTLRQRLPLARFLISLDDSKP